MKDQKVKRQQRCEKTVSEIFEVQPSHEQNTHRDRRTRDCGTQIWLEDDQSNKNQRWQHGWNQGIAPVVHGLRMVLEKEREKQNQHRFCQLRRLKRKAADMEPAMCVVCAIKKEQGNH